VQVQHLYGRTPAKDFGPKSLKAVRQRLLDKRIERKRKPRKRKKGQEEQQRAQEPQPEPRRLSRSYINKQIRIIRRMFKWAVGEELVPPSVYQGLRAVKDLQAGRTDAPETKEVRPVEWKDVEKDGSKGADRRGRPAGREPQKGNWDCPELVVFCPRGRSSRPIGFPGI
jgi:hypothetical protein